MARGRQKAAAQHEGSPLANRHGHLSQSVNSARPMELRNRRSAPFLALVDLYAS